MSVAYVSQKEASSSSAGTPLAVDKPTSLAVGDLMVAFLYGGCNVGDWATLSGWTKIGAAATIDNGDANLTVLAKIATSGDVAASNFTFTPNAAHEEKRGIIVRVTGDFTGGIAALVASDFQDNANDTASPGLTPIGINSLLFMGIISGTNTTASAYAVTNNNPSWTERANAAEGGAVPMSYALASATYASIAATGDFSWSISSTLEGVCLISISETVNVSPAPAVIGVVASIQAPAVTAGATVSPAVISMVASIQAPAVTAGESKWQNDTKPSPGTITNESKT